MLLPEPYTEANSRILYQRNIHVQLSVTYTFPTVRPTCFKPRMTLPELFRSLALRYSQISYLRVSLISITPFPTVPWHLHINVRYSFSVAEMYEARARTLSE